MLTSKRHYRTWTDQDLIDAVHSSTSIRQVLFKLNLATEGGSYETMHRNFKRLNIDTSHFTGQSGNKGKYYPRRNIEEYLVNNGPYISSSSLRQRLIREKYFENKCYNINCGITDWHNKPITCQLEHINGDHLDNRLQNLTLLCPNCHSQTETFCLGNKRSAKRNRTEKTTRIGLPARHQNIENKCKCGKIISLEAKHCITCSHINQIKIQWPSNEELEKMVWETPRSTLAKQLGVSDKAIAKRCDKLGISQPPRGYWMKNK